MSQIFKKQTCKETQIRPRTLVSVRGIKNMVLPMVTAGVLLAVPSVSTAQVFTEVDIDGNGNISFTEFYDAHAFSGLSDVELAVLFSSHADGADSLDQKAFSRASLRQSKVKLAQPIPNPVDADMMTLEPNAGPFASFDANRDGKVDFDEYAKLVVKDRGVPRTLAAQEFIRISEGKPEFDATQYQRAIITDDSTRRIYKSW